MTREAVALGVTKEEVASAKASPLIANVLCGFSYVNMTHPWLGALTPSHFLERRNNSRIIQGGGFRSAGARRCCANSTSTVHCSSRRMSMSMPTWTIQIRSGTRSRCYHTALEGAKACALADRAFRVAIAMRCGSSSARLRAFVPGLVALLAAFSGAASADPEADFFKGHPVTVYIGYAPGGRLRSAVPHFCRLPRSASSG